VQAVDRPRTVASAIRIGVPVHRAEVERIGAEIVSVDDDELLAAWSELARLEGVFCEPASAAGLAGLKRVRPEGALVVCVLTGSGLKDTATVDRVAPALEAVG
jgi:threonine synthase